MVTLPKLLPKPAEFEVYFNDGKTRTLELRPYTLRDEAYLQENYESEELAQKLQNLDPRLLAQLIWRQLTPKSKKLFKDVKAIDDDGNEVELKGYEKLMESFGGIAQIMNAFSSLMECRGLNSILEDPEFESKKKKTIKRSILRLFSIR